MEKAKHTPGPWAFKVLKYGWKLVNAAGQKVDISPDSADGKVIAAAPNLLFACRMQHEAIDRLFALCIEKIPGFMPSQSGQPWAAAVKGNEAIKEAMGE